MPVGTLVLHAGLWSSLDDYGPAADGLRGARFEGATATAQAATMSDVSEVDQKSAERFLKGRAFLGGRCRRGGTGASRANMLDPRFQRSE